MSDITRFRKTYSYYRQPPITTDVCCPADGTTWDDWLAGLELFYQWPERGPAGGDNRLITSASVALIGQMGVSGSHSAIAAETTFGVAWDELSAQSFGSNVFFYVSGSLNGADKSVYGGNVYVSGSVTAVLGLSGSHTRLTNGEPAFLAGTGISLLSSSNGAIIISATGGGGSGSLGSGSISEPRTKYIMPQTGPVDADGTIGNPYNYTSAAALGKAGPWQQAIEALQALDISDRPGSGRTIVALGGDYGSESVNILNADAPWFIFTRGVVQFSGTPTFTYTVLAGVHIYNPHLMIVPDGSGMLLSDGELRLGDTLGTSWSAILTECYFSTAAVGGALVAGSQCYLDHCTFSSTFNLPNIVMTQAEVTRINGALTVKELTRATDCVFNSVTVTVVPGGDNTGFINCGWEGTPTFNGPVDSAVFDPITRSRFITASGVYAGGAGEDDVLRVGDLMSNETVFRIHADAGSVDVKANGAAETVAVTTSDGDITVRSYGAERDTLVAADDGNVTIDANKSVGADAGDVIVEADNTITLQATNDIVGTSGDNTTFTATGLISLTATESAAMTAGAAYTATVTGGTALLTNLDQDSLVAVSGDTWIKASSAVAPVIIETRENSDFFVNGASGPATPTGASIIAYADRYLSASAGRGIVLGTTASNPSTAHVDIVTHWGDINLTAGQNAGNGSVNIVAPYQIIIDAETGIEISSGEGDIIIGGVAGAVPNIDADIVNNINVDAGGSISVVATDNVGITGTNVTLDAAVGDTGDKITTRSDEVHVIGRLYTNAGSGSVGTTSTSRPTTADNRVFRVPNVLSTSGSYVSGPSGAGTKIDASWPTPLDFWGHDGTTGDFKSFGQTIAGTAYYELTYPWTLGNERKISVWLGGSKIFETDDVIPDSSNPSSLPKYTHNRLKFEFELRLIEDWGYGDLEWSYKCTLFEKGARGNVLGEMDMGYANIGAKINVDLMLKADCTIERTEIISTGWHLLSLHT